jgi:hypothetical protein
LKLAFPPDPNDLLIAALPIAQKLACQECLQFHLNHQDLSLAAFTKPNAPRKALGKVLARL